MKSPLGITSELSARAGQGYAGMPAITNIFNGHYRQRPDWHRNFLYEQERARGFDYTEDLAGNVTVHIIKEWCGRG
jgi:hypothetical protein